MVPSDIGLAQLMELLSLLSSFFSHFYKYSQKDLAKKQKQNALDLFFFSSMDELSSKAGWHVNSGSSFQFCEISSNVLISTKQIFQSKILCCQSKDCSFYIIQMYQKYSKWNQNESHPVLKKIYQFYTFLKCLLCIEVQGPSGSLN